MQTIHKLGYAALMAPTLALVLAAFSTLTFAQTKTLRFNELPTQPVNGLSFQGVTFGFTVGGVASNDARYAAGGPGQITFVQDPSLEGSAAGVLTLAFDQPTTALSFGVARNANVALTPGFTVQLFDANGAPIQTIPVNTAPQPNFTEGQFSYTGAPVGQAVITFNNPVVGNRFAFDNLTFVSDGLAGPGLPFLAASEVSDQKAGSVLIYNVYTSDGANPNAQDTRVNITNSSTNSSAIIHLFFVNGANCSVADSFICLTENQTASFRASDLDPGTTGYIVAVASNSTGCPINFNYLIGDLYVKFASGHKANLGAEAIAAIAAVPDLVCGSNSETARLAFNGVTYNRLPRVVALDNIPARADGNDTMLILNRIGGSLMTSAMTLTNLFGILYDDAETPLSFSFSPGVCQFRSSISNNFPRITPRFETFVPGGRSGWLKLYSNDDQAILGAAINFNPNAATVAGAFSQGHNLHKLTLTQSAIYTIPVIAPGCQ